jgi:hypothetical protein
VKWLPLLIYVLAAPTIAGAIVIAILSMSGFTNTMLVAGALAGFVLAIPVAWIISRNLGKSISA